MVRYVCSRPVSWRSGLSKVAGSGQSPARLGAGRDGRSLAAFPAVHLRLPWAVPDSKPVTVALVLTTPAGTALRRNTFNRQVWAPALRMTGVEQTRDNGMQACRHTYAKVLLDAGESIKAVSEYLGHATPDSPSGRTRS